MLKIFYLVLNGKPISLPNRFWDQAGHQATEVQNLDTLIACLNLGKEKKGDKQKKPHNSRHLNPHGRAEPIHQGGVVASDK